MLFNERNKVWETSIVAFYDISGVDLDAGSIIGIVVGALVLLLIVFILIFARATGRWCFAGEYRLISFVHANLLRTTRLPVPFSGDFSCTFVTPVSIENLLNDEPEVNARTNSRKDRD